MRTRFAHVFCAMLAVAGIVATARLPVEGQATPGAETSGFPPRTPDGHPDLQGTWVRYGVQMLESGVKYPSRGTGGRAYPEALFLEPAAEGKPGERRRSGIVDPPDQRLPWQPGMAKQRMDVFNRHLEPQSLRDVDPQIRCMLPGVPRNLNGVGGYQFLQTRDKVVLLYEYNHAYRIIPLDGRPRIGRNLHLFMGDSRGHWEGNTLVVETTNFSGRTWYDVYAIPQTTDSRVVERFTLVNADLIDYEVTIDDPKVFTTPWKVAGGFTRAKDGYQLFEYACVEGDKSLENQLGPPKPAGR